MFMYGANIILLYPPLLRRKRPMDICIVFKEIKIAQHSLTGLTKRQAIKTDALTTLVILCLFNN